MQMTAEQLKPQFDPFGNILEVIIVYDKSTQMSKGAFGPQNATAPTKLPHAHANKIPLAPGLSATQKFARSHLLPCLALRVRLRNLLN